MFDGVFTRPLAALDASLVGYLRPWIRNAQRIPAPPYAGAAPPTPEHALLMLSLTYGAGLRARELARMRLDALLDEDGAPRERVRIAADTTTERRSRRVAMHPDIRRDVLAFRDKHPGASFVAFVPLLGGSPRPEPMSPHGLESWFRRLFHNAGFERLSVHSGRRMFNACARRADHG